MLFWINFTHVTAASIVILLNIILKGVTITGFIGVGMYTTLVMCLMENINTVNWTDDYLVFILDHLILSGWPYL